MVWFLIVKKIEDMFICFDKIDERDGRTDDGHRTTRGKNSYFRPVSRFIACCPAATARCYKHDKPDRGKLVTFIAGIAASFVVRARRRRSVYDKKPQRYSEDNRMAFNCTHI